MKCCKNIVKIFFFFFCGYTYLNFQPPSANKLFLITHFFFTSTHSVLLLQFFFLYFYLDFVCVWIELLLLASAFFFFLGNAFHMGLCLSVGPTHCAQDPLPLWPASISRRNAFVSGSRALFTGPTNLFFSNFFIKNGSHGTIHTFKKIFCYSFQF